MQVPVYQSSPGTTIINATHPHTRERECSVHGELGPAAASAAHLAWDRVYDTFVGVLQQALVANGHSFTASAQPFVALSQPHA